MKSSIEHDYSIGDKVYLKSDPDNTERYVTGILLRRGNNIEYELSSHDNAGWHYDFEISIEKNVG